MSVLHLSRSCLARAFGALALLLSVGGCVDTSRDAATAPPPAVDNAPAAPAFSVSAMLAQLEILIDDGYEELSIRATGLADNSGALANYCAEIGGAGEAEAFAAAARQWRQTMAAAQAAEMHALGPAADNGGALRHRVLSYADGPLSACGIDQSVLLAQADDFRVSARSLNQRGLGAIEYLLFNDDLEHGCAPQVPVTATWNDLPATERRRSRCELSLLLAADVRDAAASLARRWDDYAPQFLDPDNEGASLQALTDALFAMETLVKDQKLGIPTGLADACSARVCPQQIESPYSTDSLANVLENIHSFAVLFNGADGPGFDDQLAAAGFPQVAERFNANLSLVQQVLGDASDSLGAQVAAIADDASAAACVNAFASPDTPSTHAACRAVGVLKRLTDDLKIDFVAIVGVSIPDSAQSDND